MKLSITSNTRVVPEIPDLFHGWQIFYHAAIFSGLERENNPRVDLMNTLREEAIRI